ncbi:MAG: hypothetical protein CBD28_001795 [Rhizobiales bacterium TMED168]|nr:MAG: hypothetical protein CBD28_001795 [Rhizobiales bacterium TMED168]|tara:strand:+ start:11100 stop:11507 length:408 start_codon:yes stop_codon:yes gene_type:complete
MEEFQIWSIWSSNRIGSGLVGIGSILSIWLALRIAVATRNSDETNLFAKIMSTAFGLIVLAFSWMQATIVVNTWVSTSIALTQLKEETGSISSVAEGYLDYVGTTDPATMPLPLGIAFFAVVAIIILGQIWMPKK